MLLSLGVALLLLAALSLSKVDKKFEVGNMVILIATFLQTFFILYFVHWRWHRFDISFDAVVKFFSSGFLLATSLAMVYEWVLSFIVGIASYIIIVFDLTAETKQDQIVDKEFIVKYVQSHLWLYAIGVFVHAFVIAAVVEELCKYFAFWMCPHPDLISEAEWNDIDESLRHSNTGSSDESRVNVIRTLAEDASERTLKSRGFAISVSMVTAALGFACCENLLYVFTGSPGASIGMGEFSF